jgi:ATP-dependent DNA helicase RecG
MQITLQTSLKNLTRVGQVTAGRLKTLGLSNVRDLLFYYPARYEDYSQIIKIKDLRPETKCTVQGVVEKISNRITPYKRQKITECWVQDETGRLKIIWFNQFYLAAQIKAGDRLSLAGKIDYDGRQVEMRSPDWERIDLPDQKTIHTAKTVPVYPLTEKLTQKQLRFLVAQALQALNEIEEWLPDNNFQLLNLREAVKNIHYPESKELLAKARYRLKFDELLLLQLRQAITRYDVLSRRSPKLGFKEEEIKKFVAGLPFKLTDAQRKTAWQIIKDIGRETPMNRLLQGDVGSGKTVVALIAMLNTVLNGYQTVLMAPTEILAKQHFTTICSLLENWKEIEIVLWTRSTQKFKVQPSPENFLGSGSKFKVTAQKSKFLEFIQNGKANLIIGTHALIQENIKFNKLGLAIVDEQHRFGVEQRKALREKSQQYNNITIEQFNNTSPHFLSMTATPIPRSLALTVYGDLDLSILNEMPQGRKKIITQVVPAEDRQRAYDFIQKQIIELKHQIFVICPLIEESDILGVKAATTEFEKLNKEVFPHLKIGLLHGKLKDKEKDEIQIQFSQGMLDILVSTSVVEVGVDVPNATVMMIEGAERFGLAQLHQFRGRVGRGLDQSYCFLFTESHSRTVFHRLEFLAKNYNGFKIAEYDLKLRGAGSVYSTEQHGFPEFKIASFEDYNLIELTQGLARQLIEKDFELKSFPTIKKKLEQEGGVVHLE